MTVQTAVPLWARRLFYFSLLFLVGLTPSRALYAASSEIQPLDFGTIAITSNAAVSTITYPYSGAPPSINGNIVFLSRGHRGIYQLSAFPSYTPLIINVVGDSLTAGGLGSSEPLSLSAFSYPTLTTDANGEALLYLGATLSTSGSGAPYIDAPYLGNITITINW